MPVNTLYVTTNRITAILKGQRGIATNIARQSSGYFGTIPWPWLNRQQAYELRMTEIASGKEFARQVQPQESVQVTD